MEIKTPKPIEKKINEINNLIDLSKDLDDIVGGYFGSTMYSYLDFNKHIKIKNQFVYIEYNDGWSLQKERYNFNKDEGMNSKEELNYELSRILKAYRKALK
jgi:hypothetical protein